MATALNSIKNSTASSLRGYGGLASGLDRDTLIEGMTASTKAKIAKQQKKKQTYAWQQESYRSISSKLVEFSKKIHLLYESVLPIYPVPAFGLKAVLHLWALTAIMSAYPAVQPYLTQCL